MIERLIVAMSAALDCNKFLQNPSNSISNKKKSVVSRSSQPKIEKASKPCLKVVSIARKRSLFLQASLSLPTETAADSETPCVYALHNPK